MNEINTYIGIGSNMADPVQQVVSVIPELAQLRQSSLIACSSLYQSEAQSDIEQDDYINAVVCLRTSLQPIELLLELQAIEHAYYRQRSEQHKWGPRTMDLDIILYDKLQQDDSHLTIPHAQMKSRLFVLLPLQEITDELYIAGLGSLDYLIEHALPLQIKRLDIEIDCSSTRQPD